MSRVYKYLNQDKTNRTHRNAEMSLKLDIGCGGRGTMYPDFIGIDIWPEPKEPRTPGTKYIQMNFIQDNLRWTKNSVDEIVCFHVLEHRTRSEGVEFLRRMHHILKPGAKAYVSTPDCLFFAQKYVEGDADFFKQVYPKNQKEMWPGRTTLDRFFIQMVDNREWGHQTPYDVETLTDAAKQAGFKKIKPLPTGRDGGEKHFWCKRPDHECGLILEK